MEREKLLIEIIKIRLLFFSAVVGGSFGYFVKVDNFLIGILLSILMVLGSIGIIKSLHNLGEIYKELKENNERNS